MFVTFKFWSLSKHLELYFLNYCFLFLKAMDSIYLRDTLIFHIFLLCITSSAMTLDSVEVASVSHAARDQMEQKVGQHFRIGGIPILGFSNIRVFVPPAVSSNVSSVSQFVADEISTLKSSPSINQAIHFSGMDTRLPEKDSLPLVFRSKDPLLTNLPATGETRMKLVDTVLGAITRSLNFYGSHLEEIANPDTALVLMFLKEIDNRHDGTLQKTFPLTKWIQSVWDQAAVRDEGKGDFFKSLSGQWNSNVGHWKSASILEQHLNLTDDQTLKNIGDEKEEIWTSLVSQCQQALSSRCEIPYICERTLLDPTPRSQYFLTHQLLQRILVSNADCPSNPGMKSFGRDEETYNNLCTKIYMETKYLDVMDVPPIYRDLFSEMVGLCGYMRYPNFLREDWLNRILSWQSKSEVGCFLKSAHYPANVISSDVGIKRQASSKEQALGDQPTEMCLPHFTATSLLALSTYFDYLLDSQVN